MIQNAVIGANGVIGRALMEHLTDAVGTYRNSRGNLVNSRRYEYLDITNPGAVYYFINQHKPRRIFITASITGVDYCESVNTDNVNVYGIKRIINNAYLTSAKVVFFSSPYVFDGEKETPYRTTDITYPLNQYGTQKEKVEKFLTSYPSLDWIIVRTVGVFGKEETPKSFASMIAHSVRNNSKVVVPADQTINPIWAIDLAKITMKISERYTRDIFHVAGNECMSKYDFAIKIAYAMGHKDPHSIIIGTKSDKMKQEAIRPKNGCLDCNELSKYAIKIPSFQKGLKKYLE